MTITYPDIEATMATKLDQLLAGDGWPAWAKVAPDAYRRYLQAHAELAAQLEAAGVRSDVIATASIALTMAWDAGQRHASAAVPSLTPIDSFGERR